MPEYFISREAAEQDALACAAFIAERMPAGDERSEAIATVVPQYLSRGEVDLAAELSNSVDDPFMRDRLLIAVAAKCAETDDDEYALQLADAIEEYGLQSRAREAIALIKAGKGDLARAREIADSVLHPDDVLGGIAAKQAESGDGEAANRTVSEIEYPGAAAAALLAMAAVRNAKGEKDAAADDIAEAAARAEEVEHDEEKIRLLTEAGNLLIDCGKKGRAIEMFEKARAHAEVLDNVHRDALLAGVSLGFMHAGSVELADRTLDMVMDKTQIANALLGFAREYWQRGEHDEALEILEEANDVLRSQGERETRDSKAKFALFGSIAGQFAGFGKGERAIELAEVIEDDDQSQATLASVARILTTQRSDELARQALNAITSNANRIYALIGMSDEAESGPSDSRSEALLDEALEMAAAEAQISVRVGAIAEIGSRYFAMGAKEKGANAIKQHLDLVEETRSSARRAAMLVKHAEFAERYEFELEPERADIFQRLTAAATAKA